MDIYVVAYITQLVMSTCFLIILLFLFIVFYRASLLHANVRCFIILSDIAQICMLVAQIVVILRDVFDNFHIPETRDNVGFWMAFHEAGYAATTLSTGLIALERLYATAHLGEYEKRGLSPVSVLLAIATVPFAVLFGFMVHIVVNYPFGMTTAPIVESTVFGLVLISYRKGNRRWLNSLGTTTLNGRYQIREVAEFNRALLPSCLVGTAMKGAALIPLALWLADIESFGSTRVCFFFGHSMTCILTKVLLAWRHRGLRQTIRRILQRSSQITPSSHPNENAAEEAERHFERLKSSWDAALPALYPTHPP